MLNIEKINRIVCQKPKAESELQKTITTPTPTPTVAHLEKRLLLPTRGGSSSSCDLQASRPPATSGNFAGGISRRDYVKSSS